METTDRTLELSYEYGPVRETSYSDYVIACVVCLGFCIFFSLFTRELYHWFIFPTLLCGILIGADAVAWCRGKYDTFDIKGLIGLYGFHFFFTAPLIYIYLDLETAYVSNPDDWRPWFGYLAYLNIIGIICYKLFQRIGLSGTPKQKSVWCINPGRTWFVLNTGIVLAILGQATVLVRAGGLRGLMRAQFEGEATVFAGLGTFRILGISLPLLCFIAFTLYIYINRISIRNNFTVLFSLAIFGVFQLILAGGYSSRGMVLTSVFWVLGIIHFYLRPLTQKFLIMLLIPGIMFLWVYSFYKALGPQVIGDDEATSSIGEIAERSGKTFGSLLIGDLSRVNIQAFILYAQTSASFDYDYRYGRTYIEAFAPIIPRWIWRSKPLHSGKVRAGTELQHGKHYYQDTRMGFSSRAYGLAGESMLNFGFWGVPFAYAVWGFLIGRFRRHIRSLQAGDLRFFYVPYILWLLFNILVWDLDNYISHTIMRAIFSLIVIYLMAEKCYNSYYPSSVELVETYEEY